MRINWFQTASCAAVLVMVPFIYSVYGLNEWEFPGVSWLEASGGSPDLGETVAPADIELVRDDGALIRLRADQARVWRANEPGAQPDWVELSGNVVVDTPEGEIRAARLEYDPQTGTYTAPALSLRPASVTHL